MLPGRKIGRSLQAPLDLLACNDLHCSILAALAASSHWWSDVGRSLCLLLRIVVLQGFYRVEDRKERRRGTIVQLAEASCVLGLDGVMLQGEKRWTLHVLRQHLQVAGVTCLVC